jgi:4-hydroxy-tetrahydrodipicolinate synthase
MNAVSPLWIGTGVALLTLFDDDRAVASDATASLAADLVSLGVRAVLVNGTTGEAAALTDDERITLVAAVRAACPDVPVIGGASGEWWGPAAARAAAAVKAGADAVLVAPPRTATDLVEYYGRVSDAVGERPVLAYHFPPRGGGAVPIEMLPSLPVRGIKDSSGDAERLVTLVDSWSGWTYTGAAMLTGYAGLLGATGTILAAANLAPEDCVTAWAGDAAAQRRLLATHRATRDRFPHGLKAAVSRRFGTPTAARMG